MLADVIELAARRAVYQQRVESKLADEISSTWRLLRVGSLDSHWGKVSLNIKRALAASQYAAAQGASKYVDAAVSAQSALPERLAAVPAQSFAGIAADGRELAGAVVQPLIGMKIDLAHGRELADTLERGERRMLTLVKGELGNTARIADGVALALEPQVVGYIRHVSAKACARCLVLSGKFFRRNKGFDRHPKCHCTHVALIDKQGENAPDSPQRGMEPPGLTVAKSPASLLDRYGNDPKKFRNALRANGYLS